MRHRLEHNPGEWVANGRNRKNRCLRKQFLNPLPIGYMAEPFDSRLDRARAGPNNEQLCRRQTFLHLGECFQQYRTALPLKVDSDEQHGILIVSLSLMFEELMNSYADHLNTLGRNPI